LLFLGRVTLRGTLHSCLITSSVSQLSQKSTPFF